MSKWKATKDPLTTGKGSDAKLIPVHLYLEEGIDELYILSKRQAGALLKISQYLEWTTRLDGLPTDLMLPDDLQAWNDQLKQRLMLAVEICAEIINCIGTDEDTQAALNTFISNYLANNNYESPGKPVSTTAATSGLQGETNPTCDLDIVWSQSLMIVKTTDSIVRDLLEKFETLTNPIELTAAAAEAIPLVGDLVGSVPNYIAIVQQFLSENYNADYTTTPITGYEDMLSCEIFCSAKSDCNITIDRIYNILLARIDARFSTGTPVLSTLNELAAFVLGIDTEGEFIADLCHFLVWGGIKLANFIVGGLLNRPQIGTSLISVWLELAVDNASSDWLTICTECPEFTNIVYEANPIQEGLTLATDDGQFLGGDNRIVIAPHTAHIVLPMERRIRKVSVIMAEATELGNEVIIESVSYDLVRGTYHGGTTYTYDADIPDVACVILDFQFIYDTVNERVILSGVNSFVLQAWVI